MRNLWGEKLYRTADGNWVPSLAWWASWWRYRKVEACPKGGKHVSEVGHGGDFCIKCGKVGVEP